ncbi:MAG TPA: hypothetical protein VGK74_26970 [Symbiobacteriaceae bacterium]|jgi:hypothetical protein
MILRADLTGDSLPEEVWAGPGQLRVLSASGKKMLTLSADRVARFTDFRAEAVDLGTPLPVLWIEAGPSCPAGNEHGFYAYDKATDQLRELLWFGCATVVHFDKEKRMVSFAQRVIPAYDSYTYRYDGTDLVQTGSYSSVVPQFVTPGNVGLALSIILGNQGHDGGLITDVAVRDAFVRTWSGKGADVSVTGPEAYGREFTGVITVTNGSRTATGTIHMVESKDAWYVDRLDVK